MSRRLRFSIDRGGTFTDVFCKDGETCHVLKLLSKDPAYKDAPSEGIRRVLEKVTGKLHARQEPIDTSLIASIRMGTTVATNALLERRGDPCVLLITKGFKDLLFIGNQSRPNIFDLEIKCPDVLYEEVIEVEERVCLAQEGAAPIKEGRLVRGVTGEEVEVVEELNADKLREDLKKKFDMGYRAAAVMLLHSYTFPAHEQEVGRLCREIGYTQVSLSSEIMPMVKAVPRGFTSCADAYLTPSIQRYLSTFKAGFDEGLKDLELLFMQSDGGLSPVEKFNGFRAILSGPAGGVVGYAKTCYEACGKRPVIGFDMGGTSTDVSRFDGHLEHVFETTTAGVTIQAPQLDISTVAAGGGSCLRFESGMFKVGPESSSAFPGPSCYRRGGPLSVTDANLELGRILWERFPKIFGPKEDEPLDVEATRNGFRRLTEEINGFMKKEGADKELTTDEVAFGFIKVANEAMCRPIRALTSARGFDIRSHVLACFGGAGGQHACAIARSLGIGTIFIHRYASILSAYGLFLAKVVEEVQEPCSCVLEADQYQELAGTLNRLQEEAEEKLVKEGHGRESIRRNLFLNLRYEGTDCAVMTALLDKEERRKKIEKEDIAAFSARFLSSYKREFGFLLEGRKILVDDIRVRAEASSGEEEEGGSMEEDEECLKLSTEDAEQVVSVYFEGGRQDTPVFLLDKLRRRRRVTGPAILLDDISTLLVEPGCEAELTRDKDVRITVGKEEVKQRSEELDLILLSIFSHRFMSIAEQMGRTLQRTSMSTNIKERLDFSCALFDEQGGLVANAPHIPVHLGSMQDAVRYQVSKWQEDLEEGDVLMTNHPCAGGTHLPDITVITPVFLGRSSPVFFLASRGHHADIGGIAPGSMPPHSRFLFEEGMCCETFKLVRKGAWQEEGVVELLNSPAKHPGCAGSRKLRDNLSDLRAQVAANQKGVLLLNELIAEFGLDLVLSYMHHIQSNAELAVRDMLKETAQARISSSSSSGKRNVDGEVKEKQLVRLHAEDAMDDGTPIVLNVEIDINNRSAHFDFTGTGTEVYGNCNAPRAVTYSAIIYCLRAMVRKDIPLNQGCLAPITVTIPPGSILFPDNSAAVVGGNVLTSQRVTDVILKAFSYCAASQGCMNNVTFGDASFGYYETIAGGAGAGPTWDGRGGVHTHMTNTRITDVEILERRFPVMVKAFGLREGSGGGGMRRGGDGVVRELLFRRKLELSVLTERRVLPPYGLMGGEPGKVGINLLFRHDGRVLSLGGKNCVTCMPGDSLRILTPGGGGYGKQGEEGVSKQEEQTRTVFSVGNAASGSLKNYEQMQYSA